MRLLLLAALLATAASARAQDHDPLAPRTEPRFTFTGVFAYFGSLCDCDTRDIVFLTRRAIPAHAEPDPSSPVVRTVAANRLIEGNDWDAEVTVVTRAATGALRRPLRIAGASRMADPRRSDWDEAAEVPAFTLPAGTRVAVYDAYSDYGYINAAGVTYSGSVPMGDEVRWDQGGEGSGDATLWWRLLPRNGEPAAWIEVDWRDERRFRMLCETHGGCESGFTPSFRPNR